MLLDLTPDQAFFRETTARFLDELRPGRRAPRLRDDPTGSTAEYWRRGAELGWTSLLVDEEHGGGSISGTGSSTSRWSPTSSARHAAPGPLVPTNVVAAALSDAADGATPTLLAGLLAGTSIASWCLGEPPPNDRLGDVAARDPGRRRRRRAQRREAPGRVGRPGRATCSSPVAPATGLTQVLVPDRRRRRHRSRRCARVDLTRRFSRRALRRRARAGRRGRRRGRRRRRPGRAPAAARRSSSPTPSRSAPCRRAFDMTVEWAFDRYSFGRPLASYQALKHRFADMKTWLEASHAISDAAAAAVAAARARRRRAGERGQGLHRRVRRRAAAGLRAAARRHRRDLRARPAPLPAAASPSTARCYGTPAEHRQRITDHRRATDGRGMSAARAHRSTSTDDRGRRELPPAGPRVDPGQPPAARAGRPTAGVLRNDRTDEEELADVARDRELQRMLFDAGLAGICFPTRVRRPGPHPGAPAGAQRGARRLRVPDRGSRRRRSRRASRCCSTSAPRSRSCATSPPS